MGQCHSCGVELPRDVPIFRETECPNCSRPLKVCLNCAFYERGAQWDCRVFSDNQDENAATIKMRTRE